MRDYSDPAFWSFLTALVMLLPIVTLYLTNRNQQHTIDRLTDKLMAKDYGEYKRNNHITISNEKPPRKAMSYYDDPSVDLEQ